MIHYFLFGTEAVNAFEDNESTDLDLSKNDGVLFKYDDSELSPLELLAAFEGWNRFQELTPEQYKEIALYNGEEEWQ